MAPTPPSRPARAGLAAALLLPGVFLGACSAIGGGDGCGGTRDALMRLAAESPLDAAPAGATEPAGRRGVSTGCDDDSSGKPWLHADRRYAFPGSRDEVITHYTGVAAAAGWTFERDPSPDAAPAAVEGACWTKTDKGRHLLLDVDFRPDGSSPAPAAGTALTYEVSVGTTSDGSNDDGEATCWH
ncbi:MULTISPECIES: hypothetical protein [unclassified Streptomyces]|uniref:hypothetical protein n=1 Tax=unclassified Streptomyces TaxID=2593676 RepID=UPI0036FC5F31